MTRREMLMKALAASPAGAILAVEPPVEVAGDAKMLIFSVDPVLWNGGDVLVDAEGLRKMIDDTMRKAGIKIPYMILAGMKVEQVK